ANGKRKTANIKTKFSGLLFMVQIVIAAGNELVHPTQVHLDYQYLLPYRIDILACTTTPYAPSVLNFPSRHGSLILVLGSSLRVHSSSLPVGPASFLVSQHPPVTTEPRGSRV